MPRLRSLCLAWGALAAVVAAGELGGAARPWSYLPARAAVGAPPAVDPEGPRAVVPLGRPLPLPTADGRVVEVVVLAVRLRHGSHRLVDVRLRYELRRGAGYAMDPAHEAQLVDGSGQLLNPAPTSDRLPALRRDLLQTGHPIAGWVTFVRPTAARAARVQVTLDAGAGPRTGQWRVSSQTP